MKAIQKFLDAFMDEGVVSYVVGPVFQLLAAGQFAKNDEISGFEVGAALRKFFDGIPAISQDSGVAIDESDLTLAQSRVVERGIVAHHSEIALIHFDLAEIECTDRIVRDRHLVGFAIAVVSNGERVPAHSIGLSERRLRYRFDWIHCFCLSLSDQGSASMYTKLRPCGIVSSDTQRDT